MQDADRRFLALGDSYTIGEGVAEHQGWPSQLVARLRARGVGIADPQIIARTGWTTDELASAMDAGQFRPPYALVTLLIGVNNQYRGRRPGEYREQFGDLLQRAIALAGSDPRRALAISIPDWGATPFARGPGRDPQSIAAQIDGFNAVARELADACGTAFVDVTGISRDPRCRNLLVADDLHPSAAQYTRWLEAIAPVAAEIVAR